MYAGAGADVVALRRGNDGRLGPLAGDSFDAYPLAAPTLRVVAPADGAGVLVLVGTAAATGIESFQRDPATGGLSFVETETGDLGIAASLAVSQDGLRVYAASPSQDGVVVYGREPGTGALTFLQRVREQDAGVDGLLDAFAVTVSPDDRHVYVSALRQDGGETRGTIALLRREPDGSLAFVEAIETGDLADPLGLIDLLVTPDGAEVIGLDGSVLSGPAGALLRFARAAGDGRLSFVERTPLPAPGPFGDSADWLALRPDGRRLYVGGLTWPVVPIVWAYERDAGGALSLLDSLEPPSSGLLAGGATSGDGRYLYTSGAQVVRVLALPEAAGPLAALAVLAGLALSRWARRG